MQSVEFGWWGWTEFRLVPTADITVDLLNLSRGLEDIQDSAYPKDT
jgi:hypothetical protein